MFRLRGYLGEWYRRKRTARTGINTVGRDFPGSGLQFGPIDSWRCYATRPGTDSRSGSDTVSAAVYAGVGIHPTGHRSIRQPLWYADGDAPDQCPDRDW